MTNKVLVVDDEKLIVKGIKFSLEQDGMEVTAAYDGKEEAKQSSSKQAFIFVRKVKEENGITLPYTFVGVGHLRNPRKNESTNGSILYDIHLDTPLPDDLYQDFEWTE